MIDYRTCNECTEKYCKKICENYVTDFETKIKEKMGKPEVSVDYELNY